MCDIGKKVRMLKVPKDKPLVGYRGWLNNLVSLYTYGFRWKGVGEETAATSGTVAAKNTVGLYAFKTEEDFKEEVGHGFGAKTRSSLWHTNPSIHGVVEMWGTVVEHEKGYRASHARITKIVRGKNKVK